MAGRADFEDRREARKEGYEELAKKAEVKSSEYMNSRANRILESTPGQPIIIGHHSERYARKLHEKAWQDIGKSIEEDKKSKYYKDKVKTIDEGKVIYNDDPRAIEKLYKKLEGLEVDKRNIKADENHTSWQLQNINAAIRETKKRIERLQRLENIEFEDIEFKGGKAIHNKEINRIQLIFDSIPSEEIRSNLKSKGFHWSRREGAWQRLFNENAIRVVNRLVKDVLNMEQEEEEEFG